MSWRWLVALLMVAALGDTRIRPAAAAGEPDVRGAWRPERYVLKNGTTHRLAGFLFFTDRDWTTLYFVMGEGQAPQRGMGEGGTYTLTGNRLVFTHLYGLTSAASALPGLPESQARAELHEPASAKTEPCTVEVQGDRLTIRFGPSGNAIEFRRSSRF